MTRPPSLVNDAGDLAVAGGRMRSELLYRFPGALLSDADFEILAARQIRLIVDLRGHSEDRSGLEEWATRTGVRYHHEPIEPTDTELATWTAGLTTDEATERLRQVYCNLLDHYGPRFAAAISIISQNVPSAFGCAAGKDRTGLLAALIQILLGACTSDVVDRYVTAPPPSEALMPIALHWRKVEVLSAGSRAMLSAPAAAMAHTLEYLGERFGGVVPYLRGCGLDLQSMTRLRKALVIATC